jgi:hypothetical protein
MSCVVLVLATVRNGGFLGRCVLEQAFSVYVREEVREYVLQFVLQTADMRANLIVCHSYAPQRS